MYLNIALFSNDENLRANNITSSNVIFLLYTHFLSFFIQSKYSFGSFGIHFDQGYTLQYDIWNIRPKSLFQKSKNTKLYMEIRE